MRVAADHEGFADLDAGAGADGKQGLGFGDGEADGLFAEDVLAGFGGLDGPRHVHLVGQRIVDGVDVGVGEQLFVRPVCLGDAELRRASLALARSREAMASTVVNWPCCMAGRTFLIPMFAVLSTPQRSFFDMAAMINWRRARMGPGRRADSSLTTPKLNYVWGSVRSE